MQIENLPYPVYVEGSPDYLGVLFNVDLDEAESPGPLHFSVRGKFSIQNEDLLKLIAEGRAGFGLFVECDQTDYRELRPCAMKFEESFIKAYFSETVVITPVIYATEEIENYRNSDLIEELQMQEITIPEGAVMAADKELILTITRSQLQTVGSICKFKPGDYPSYDLEGDSIVLTIPREVFDRYSKMTRNQKIQITSMYFPPVLENIIDTVFAEGFNEYSDRKWYDAIKKSLELKNINPSDNDAYVAMMAVLGDLLVEGSMYVDSEKGESQ